MKKLIACGLLVALVCSLTAPVARAEAPAKKNPHLGQLRHVVLLKFKDDTTAEQVKAIEEGFLALPKKIAEVNGLEWGTNCSPEPFSQGFSHCFQVTFKDAAARDAYLPHPAHQEFVKVLKPHLDKVLVIDYVIKE